MKTYDRTALVIGISGGFGGHVARALRAGGWSVRALMRDPAKLPPDLADTRVIAGDAGDPAAVARAMEGAGVVVYGANVPYPRWQEEALPLLEPTVAAAERQGVRVVFPGNVYNFDPDDGPVFDEDAPQNARTRKGRIRVAMERRLQEAARRGAKVLVVRCGDFFGAGAPSAWLNEIVKRRRDGTWRFVRPARPEHDHAWAYLPDVAATVARLLEDEAALDAHAVYHFHGHQATLAELERALEDVVGADNVSVGRLPWPLMTLASPFVPFVRELRELRYLWQREVALADDKLRAAIGRPPHTPLPDALAATLRAA